jgi:DnaJ-class molecular chaperone
MKENIFFHCAEFFTIDASSGGFGGSFGGLYGMGKTAPSTSIGPGESAGRNEFPTTQDAPVERPLPLTLEELFLGTVKKIKITKKVRKRTLRHLFARTRERKKKPWNDDCMREMQPTIF